MFVDKSTVYISVRTMDITLFFMKLIIIPEQQILTIFSVPPKHNSLLVSITS